MQVELLNDQGQASSNVDVPETVFGRDYNESLIHQLVVAYQANARQGTRAQKDRQMVKHSTKKPFKQKGTGMARQGSKVGPHQYHGAVAHGPQPHDWSQKINKKMKKLALSRALFDRALDGEIVLIANWEVSASKAKIFNQLLGSVAPEGRVLIVDDAWNDQNILAARNIARVDISEAKDVNSVDLCDHATIILSEKGLDTLLSRTNGGK